MGPRGFWRQIVRGSRLATRVDRFIAERRRAATDPDWASFLAQESAGWEAAKGSTAHGPRVLVATSNGGHPSAPVLDTLLGIALTLRGASVEFLLCDSFLPACKMAEHSGLAPAVLEKRGPQAALCGSCQARGERLFRPLGLRVRRWSELVSPAEADAIRQRARETPMESMGAAREDGIAVGEHAWAGALRYFARSHLEGEPHGEAVLRRYFEAALLSAAGARRLFRERKFQSVVVTHGIYVPHGVVAEAARLSGTRLVTWDVAYRRGTFLFAHGDTYHRALLEEPADAWEAMPWTPEMESDLLAYLASRRTGGRDWIAFQPSAPVEDLAALQRALPGFPFDRPHVGLLTNVAWDAQIHYPANAFRDMLDWLDATVEYFSRRADLPLLIRVHPAEVRGDIPSRQRVLDHLRDRWPRLPPNVFVVPPDSPLGTYALMERADAVLIYGTKTGVELTSLGVPVIVAGEAWIRNKGLTRDVRDRAEYERILDALPEGRRLDAARLRRARRYAYHFFFRRMIPLGVVRAADGQPPFAPSVRRLDELGSGRDPGLDVVCAGILEGRPFVFPAERLTRAAAPLPARAS